MNQIREIFCFTVDNQRYAFPLISVDRILQAVEVNRVPNSPPLIHGLIDLNGSLVPVVNLRYRLKLPDQPIRASDYFIVVDTPKRKIALVIDEIEDVIIPSAKDLVPASALDMGLDATGILRCDDGIILIYDLETFISSRDEEVLQEILDAESEK